MKKKNIIIISLIVIIILIIAGYFAINKINQAQRKYAIEAVTEYKYLVVKENNKYGVIDKNGNKIVNTQYDNLKIPNPSKAIFFCYEGNNIKVLNQESKEVFNEYDSVEPLRLKNISSDLMYEKSALKYSKNGKYGIIDFNGKKITNAIYDEIDTLQYKEGELLVKKDNKYGVINIKGTVLVKNKYDKIEADKYYTEENGYKEAGYIVSNTTENGYRYGYVNKIGKQLLETKYNDLFRVCEINNEDNVYIICAENGKYGIYKNNKKVIENEYQSLTYDENNNLFVALKGKKYGVFSIEGNIIVPFEYSQIDINGEYIYAKSSDETIKVLDTNGVKADIDSNTVITKIANTNYEIYIQTKNNKTTYNIYENNVQKTKNEYIYIEYLYDKYFTVCTTNGKLGIIDSNENKMIDFQYTSIQKVDNTDLIQTNNSNKQITEIYSSKFNKICELENATLDNKGEYIKLYNDKETKYISKNGDELKNTEVYTNNKIFAKQQNGLWGFVDASGRNVVEYKYNKATEVNEYGYAAIEKDGKWGTINGEGKIVVEPTYDLKEEPEFIGEYYQVTYGNGEIYYTNLK